MLPSLSSTIFCNISLIILVYYQQTQLLKENEPSIENSLKSHKLLNKELLDDKIHIINIIVQDKLHL
jgi:hypothetical protein